MASALALGASSSACGEGRGSGGNACERDAVGCDAGASPAPDDCEDDSPLEARLGEGELELSLLAPGQPPTFHTGIQPGHHLFLGFRVANPDPGHPGFVLTFSHRFAERDDFRQFFTLDGLREGPDGSLQQTGFILLTARPAPGQPSELDLEIEDPCGRRALVRHPFELDD